MSFEEIGGAPYLVAILRFRNVLSLAKFDRLRQEVEVGLSLLHPESTVRLDLSAFHQNSLHIRPAELRKALRPPFYVWTLRNESHPLRHEKVRVV